ncbi:PDZ domain-containing protein [Microlunatus panaciterrae]|uniref:endopeptidase La n=1 Tax=Microlunatus panaciterrae TaxID=400768 RepID=A0ABS2RG17_9ACTN|nr:S16 family serine protease [Microlunatus panaciterrae]MBM7797482.1 PDZ domain-containing protein [Microlunatus panaciterrae]
MTRQTWVAFVSALMFVGLASLMVALPVPFVTWSPGQTHDTLGLTGSQPMIRIKGIRTFPTSGQLDLTTVSGTSADSRLTLPQAILAYWLPHRDTLPRDSVYAPGKSAEQVESEEAEMMETAQSDAVVAALRAAHQPVTEMPVVSSVTVAGPAHGRLKPGDLIVAVDGTPVTKPDQVGQRVRSHKTAEQVRFLVERNRQRITVSVPTVASNSRPGQVMVGITVGMGYSYAPDISFDLGQRIGGPSAGLIFSLAIYDKITPGALLGDRHVAGTGSITPEGKVGPIGGIQEKIGGAEQAGATVFLVPADNCKDLAGLDTDLTLVKVATLDQGITALTELDTPNGADRIPHC